MAHVNDLLARIKVKLPQLEELLAPIEDRSSEEDGEVSVLSSAETKRLFLAASPEIIPFLTLSFFRGIRPATLERLDWST